MTTKYGTLYDSATNEPIRPATLDELARSRKASDEGHISEIDGDHTSRSVYVAGETDEGAREAEEINE